MNLNQPVLTNWQKSTTAEYIRRHRWFFSGIPGGYANMGLSMYNVIFVFAPAIAGLMYLDSPWKELVFGFSILHLLAAQIYIHAALEVRGSK